MRTFFKFILLTSLVAIMGCSRPSSSISDADDVPDNRWINDAIHAYSSSLGMCIINNDTNFTKKCINALGKLDANKPGITYFKLAYLIINQEIIRGELQKASEQGEIIHNKALASNDNFAIALSLLALADIANETENPAEVVKLNEAAIAAFSQAQCDRIWIKLAFMRLAYYANKANDSVTAQRAFMSFNEITCSPHDTTEFVIAQLNNCMWELNTNRATAALVRINRLDSLLPLPVITRPNYYAIKAVISMSMGDEGSATRAADYFFRIPAVNQNSKMFTNMIQLQAGLWERHGNYTAAYGAYQKIFHIRDSIALLNNQKAVDTLIVRYQAKHIAYENTVTRKRYLLIYALAVAASLFILFILLFFTWKNIFKKRRSQQDLALAKAAAEQSITKRSFFISNMGHEIRTPLNAITGFSSLLATEDNTPEERKEYLNIISVNSQQLLKLINDILDFSDLEEGRIALNIKEHDVIKICRDTVDSIASSVPPAVKLSFRTVIPSLSIMTDDVRLRQVLINLLMNSTKFTSVGFIKLKVKIDPENSELLVFSVTDSGRGIEPDKKHIIFERFEKLNQFSPGSGLGLSICHAIVSAFGGKIWLDETYIQGAKFKFTIPIVKPDTSKDS